jgi:hypothetical protein
VTLRNGSAIVVSGCFGRMFCSIVLAVSYRRSFHSNGESRQSGVQNCRQLHNGRKLTVAHREHVECVRMERQYDRSIGSTARSKAHVCGGAKPRARRTRRIVFVTLRGNVIQNVSYILGRDVTKTSYPRWARIRRKRSFVTTFRTQAC